MVVVERLNSLMCICYFSVDCRFIFGTGKTGRRECGQFAAFGNFGHQHEGDQRVFAANPTPNLAKIAVFGRAGSIQIQPG
jgi:hypothetical protein